MGNEQVSYIVCAQYGIRDLAVALKDSGHPVDNCDGMKVGLDSCQGFQSLKPCQGHTLRSPCASQAASIAHRSVQWPCLASG